jgi:hypothetical protein
MTQAYLLKNRYFMFRFRGLKTLVVLDEPHFLRESCRRLSIVALVSYAKQIRRLKARKFIDIANAIDKAIMGQFSNKAVFRLTEGEEAILNKHSLENFCEEIESIHERNLLPTNGEYRITTKGNLQSLSRPNQIVG